MPTCRLCHRNEETQRLRIERVIDRIKMVEIAYTKYLCEACTTDLFDFLAKKLDERELLEGRAKVKGG